MTTSAVFTYIDSNISFPLGAGGEEEVFGIAEVVALGRGGAGAEAELVGKDEAFRVGWRLPNHHSAQPLQNRLVRNYEKKNSKNKKNFLT